MPNDLTPPKAVRRPQAERRAETRTRILEGAVECLHQLGFGGATIAAVAQAAGVSRGALTHHFATKTDLMLAVVRQVFEEDVDHYNRSLAGVAPRDWLRAVPATLWAAINRPSAVAVMEIMLASRSDPELAQRLRVMQGRIDAQAFAWMRERYRAAEVAPRPEPEALHRLCVAAARGLALEAVYMGNTAELERSIQVLGEALAAMHPGLLEP
jgi:AcrR family transcriptional regulator